MGDNGRSLTPVEDHVRTFEMCTIERAARDVDHAWGSRRVWSRRTTKVATMMAAVVWSSDQISDRDAAGPLRRVQSFRVVGDVDVLAQGDE